MNIRKSVTLAAILAITAVGALPALAAEAAETVTYTIDAAHSEASFQVRHLLTKVRGQFAEFDGTIEMNPADPAASSVEFTVKVASIDTDVADRDQHLRSEDFFHVEKYPEITFESTKITKTGDNTYAVTGDLTMRGVTKQITLPVTFLGELVDPWGNTKAGFETAITLNRKDFGISWNKALDQGGFILGDEVEVSIDLEVLKAKAEGEGSQPAA